MMLERLLSDCECLAQLRVSKPLRTGGAIVLAEDEPLAMARSMPLGVAQPSLAVSPDGTLLVKDINSDGSSDPDELSDIDGTLFFIADDGVHGRELWALGERLPIFLPLVTK